MRQRYPERIVQPYRTAEVAAQAQAQHPYRLSVRFHPRLQFRLGAKSISLIKNGQQICVHYSRKPNAHKPHYGVKMLFPNAPQELNR